MKKIKYVVPLFFLCSFIVSMNQAVAGEFQVLPTQAPKDQQPVLQDKNTVSTVTADSLVVGRTHRSAAEQQEQKKQIAQVERAYEASQAKVTAPTKPTLDAAAQKQWLAMLAGANAEFQGMEKSVHSSDRKRDAI